MHLDKSCNPVPISLIENNGIDLWMDMYRGLLKSAVFVSGYFLLCHNVSFDWKLPKRERERKYPTYVFYKLYAASIKLLKNVKLAFNQFSSYLSISLSLTDTTSVVVYFSYIILAQ